ncbi:hypothetical protein A2116_01995 [Candidatus Jorgensenbacteria bacterium GWA1_49_17]|uniref:Major facilitator superfamily (MFS) profile domain-containing protein n=1 Tax=Candidatus Jorgensenbacteria bacterium GWA1_49_17 TaxID=1798467 RepID=A0A1F6BUK0_9BACT|nr:MAG: hypothetical protein A2116_01995 [Candidatus Jorgensenbacteria bacterium GWA1_49_17]
MEKKLKSNIWKYTLLLIANKRIFVAILGAYYLTIPDVTPEGIGIILLAGSLAGFIFEIPSGYVSDKIGHKAALVLSRLFMLVSTLFFLVANNIAFLILGGIFLSMSTAFHSGTGSAFIHETLRGLKRENEYAKVTGKMSSIGFAVPIVLMVLTPFLVSISFKAPFLAALVVDLVGILAAFLLVTPPVSQEEIDEIKLTKFKQVVSEGHRLNFFIFALFSGIVSGALFSVGGFRAPYQLFLEVPVIWYGVLFGVGRVFASLMLAYSGKIKERISLFFFYRFQLVLYTLFILVLGLVPDWRVAVIAFIVINAFQWGLSKVDNSYLMDIIKTSKFKATLLSIRAQISQLIAAIASFGVGFLIERLSYQYGFLYLGLIFFAVLFSLYLYIINKHEEINVALR